MNNIDKQQDSQDAQSATEEGKKINIPNMRKTMKVSVCDFENTMSIPEMNAWFENDIKNIDTIEEKRKYIEMQIDFFTCNYSDTNEYYKNILKILNVYLLKVNNNIDNSNHNYNFKWKYSQNDFLELCKALFESKAVVGTQKDLINGLSELFNLKIKNQNQQMQSMLECRNDDNRTQFLDTLKSSMETYMSTRDKKKSR